MRTSFVSALAAFVLVVAGATEARANGRFPQSNAIFFAPRDPDVVLLRTTFGEMVSRDRGTTWDWVCEQSVGLLGIEDPMYAITPNGTIIGSTFQGLTVSSDRACNFAFVGGALEEHVFVDLTSRPSTPERVIALSSSYAGQESDGTLFYRTALFETVDEGKTFAPLAGVIDRALLAQTVDVAPGDPDRLYVSALRNPVKEKKAVLLTSRDHGKTFEENVIALVGDERAAYIAAVDATNAERVYVRTSNEAGKPTRLLLSDDAGRSFRSVFDAKDALAGFALSSDGRRIFVGTPTDGLHVADTTDFQWAKTSSAAINCLKIEKNELWVCSDEKSGFVLGVTSNEGQAIEPRLHFCDIRGPLACAEGSTTHTECVLGGTSSTRSPPWPVQRVLLGCEAPPEADAGTVDAGTPDTAGGGEPEGGGGCSLRPSASTPLAGLGIVLAGALALLRRRRR